MEERNVEQEKRIIKQLERVEGIDGVEQRYSLLAAKRVLDFDDAILITGLSRSYLYKLTHGRQIPHYKPNGKLLYFEKSELEAWMLQNKVSSKKEISHTADEFIMNKKLS